MHCSACGSTESRVVDTTTVLDGGEIRRRRECVSCGQRYSTVERIRSSLPMIVKDSSGGAKPRREQFDREKLRRSILNACAKRPIPEAAIDRLVASVEARLTSAAGSEVPSRIVGEMVIGGLRALDEVAYIRYAIVFMGLEDLAAIREEIDRLMLAESWRD